MPEVYYSTEGILDIGDEWLSRLKGAALASPLRRSRLRLHKGNDDAVQEMIIALCRDVLFRPHRHVKKSESFHIIEGELAVIVFDESGTVLKSIHMGPPHTGRRFYYRLAEAVWHAILPLDEFVVFHETTDGPYDPNEPAQFAPWAPAESEALRHFLHKSAGF